MHIRHRHITLLATGAIVLMSTILSAKSLIKANDRIIFIGDSITFQGSAHNAGAWVSLFRNTLKKAHPLYKLDVLGLGGCGQTVGSWSNVEKKCRTNSIKWRPDNYDLGKEIDKKADVFIIMLGMNDVLGPRVRDNEKSLAKWKETYREFIKNLRKRVQPRVFGLATPTPCTEVPTSPKNIVMDKLVVIMKELAKEENCVIIPTRQEAWEILEKARETDPDARITVDYVHPSHIGHIAIAAGMLRGLGEEKAAEELIREKMPEKTAKGIPYIVIPVAENLISNECAYIIRVCDVQKGELKLDLPKGWKIDDVKSDLKGTEYKISGKPVHEENEITISAFNRVQKVEIPAPWLVATAKTSRKGWSRSLDFDCEKGRIPTDEIVRTGADFKSNMKNMLYKNKKIEWKKYTGVRGYAGDGSPDYIDFAGVKYFDSGETAYGMRWIYSDKEQKALVKAGKSGFGLNNLECWFNGAQLFSANPMKLKQREYPVSLKKGWNLLSFKSNYIMHQWHIKLSLLAEDGSRLDGLKYAVLPE